MISGFLANLAAGTLSNIIGDFVAGKYNARTNIEIEELIQKNIAEHRELDIKKHQRYIREVLDEIRTLARSISYLEIKPGQLGLRKDIEQTPDQPLRGEGTAEKWRNRIREFELAVEERGKQLGVELIVPSSIKSQNAVVEVVSSGARWKKKLQELPQKIENAVSEADAQ